MKSLNLTKEYKNLSAGNSYKIMKEIIDYDGVKYDVGEVIEFYGSNFLPYEDGLSLFCTYKGRNQQIRLQVRADAQKEIVDNIESYLVKINGSR